MSPEEEYKAKVESLNRYVPFLKNMIHQLQDPSKQNRRQQLEKMVSLYSMITNKSKRLKLETLIKCEEVIVKLHHKVRGEHTPLPKQSIPSDDYSPESPTIDPVSHNWLNDMPALRKPVIDIYAVAGESLAKKQKEDFPNNVPNRPSLQKPPISNEDLEGLQADVVCELEKKMSLDELNKLRSHLRVELLGTEKETEINTTVRNKPVLTRINTSKSSDKKYVSSTSPSTSEKKLATKSQLQHQIGRVENTIKDSDFFGNILSSIDEKLLESSKKIDDRRTSKDEINKDKRNDKARSDLRRRFSSDFFSKKHTSVDKANNENPKTKHDEKIHSTSRHKSSDRHKKQDSSKYKAKEHDRNKDKHSSADRSLLYETTDTNKNKKHDSSKTSLVGDLLTKVSNKNDAPKGDSNDRNSMIGTLKQVSERLALKYSRKPKKNSSYGIDVDKTVTESIEQSMKQSTVIMPHLDEKTSRPENLASSNNEGNVQNPPNLNNLLKIPNATDFINTVINELKQSDNLTQSTSNHFSNETLLDNNLSYERSSNYGNFWKKSFTPFEPLDGTHQTNNSESVFENKIPSLLSLTFDKTSYDSKDESQSNNLGVQNHFESSSRTQNLIYPTPQFPTTHNQMLPEEEFFFQHNPNIPYNNFPGYPSANSNYHNTIPLNRQTNVTYNNTSNTFFPVGQEMSAQYSHSNSRMNEMGRDPRSHNFQARRSNDSFRSACFHNDFHNKDPRLQHGVRTYKEYREQKERQRLEEEARQKMLKGTQQNDNNSEESKVSKSSSDIEKQELSKSGKPSSDQSTKVIHLPESKFDKMYSNRDEVCFKSPLESLYEMNSSKSDMRSNTQKFKIPKKNQVEKAEQSNASKQSDHKKTKNIDETKRIANNEQKETKVAHKKENTKDIVDLEKKDTNKAIIPNKVSKEKQKVVKSPKGNKERTNDVEQNNARKTSNKDGSNKDSSKTRDHKEKSKKETINDVVDNENKTASANHSLNKSSVTPVPENIEYKIEQNSVQVSEVDITNSTANEVIIPDLVKETVESEQVPSNSEKDKNLSSEKAMLVKFMASLVTDPKSKKELLTSFLEAIAGENLKMKELSNALISCSSETDNGTPEVLAVKSGESEVKPLEPKEPSENVEKATNHIEEPSESTENSEVFVSVSERIKNRKRNSSNDVQTEPLKRPKRHFRTELDLLHNDIKEMFIRDGIVTATGKRMCRILKDQAGLETTGAKTNKVPLVKKTTKITGKQVKEKEDPKNMRILRVVLPKVPLEELNKTYSLRKNKRCINYSENLGVETNNENDELHDSDDNKSIKESEPNVKTPRKNKATSASILIRKKPVRRRRCNWSSSVRRKSMKKRQMTKISTNDKETNKSEINPEKSSTDNNSVCLPDKNYYVGSLDKLKCKICGESGRFLATHYRSAHPEVEVLCSRLSPNSALSAITDSLDHGAEYITNMEETNLKFLYKCIFCKFNSFCSPVRFYDHISTHTGEFRHKCPICDFTRSYTKVVRRHIRTIHGPFTEGQSYQIEVLPIPSLKNVYGYLCKTCNYVQISKNSVESHIERYHSSDDEIIKISLSCVPKIETGNIVTKPAIDDFAEKTDVLNDGMENAISDSESLVSIKKIVHKRATRLNNRRSKQKFCTNKMTNRNLKRKFSKRLVKVKQEIEYDSIMNGTLTEATDVFKKPPDLPKAELKTVEKNIFTCETDIQEENENIEKERLKTMEELNTKITSTMTRNSLEFVNKLNNRLMNDETNITQVKQEITEEEAPPLLEQMPLQVFDKSKPVEPRHLDIELKRLPEIPKSNSIITGVIDRLQDLLKAGSFDNSDRCNETSPSLNEININCPSTVETDDGPPMLKPIVNINARDQSGSTLRSISNYNVQNNYATLSNVGPLRVLKTNEYLIYSCLIPPCIFSSRDQQAFATHCQFAHDWNEGADEFANCSICQWVPAYDINTPLLFSFFNHMVNVHLNIAKMGTIRISSNLFPPKNVISETDTSETNTEDPNIFNENDDGDPLPFRILNVVSLADESEPPPLSLFNDGPYDQTFEEQVIINEIPLSDKPPTVQPPEDNILTLNTPSNQQLKCNEAIKKFISTPTDLYKCPEYFCLFSTKNKGLFEAHISLHAPFDKPYSCVYCKLLYPLSDMVYHYEIAHGSCLYACPHCLYRCLILEILEFHIYTKHGVKPTEIVYLNRPDIDHFKKLVGDQFPRWIVEPFKCCGSDFYFHQDFVSHFTHVRHSASMKCHYQRNNVKCDALVNKSAIISHWATAHKLNSLHCAFCGFGSSSLFNIMAHVVESHPVFTPNIIDRNSRPQGFIVTEESMKNHNYKNVGSYLKKAVCKYKQLHGDITAENPLLEKKRFALFVEKYSEGNETEESAKSLKSSVPFGPTSKMMPLKSDPSSILCLNRDQCSSGVTAILVQTSQPSTVASTSSTTNVKVVPKISAKPAKGNGEQKYTILTKVSKPSFLLSTPKLTVTAGLKPTKKIAVVPKIISISSVAKDKNKLDLEIQESSLSTDLTKVNDETDVTTELPLNSEAHAEYSINQHELYSSQETSPTFNIDKEILDEPLITISDSEKSGSLQETDPLSLDDSITAKANSSTLSLATEYDSDSKEVDTNDGKMHLGLLGSLLYKCAVCEESFSDILLFKSHLVESLSCKSASNPAKPYQCIHCGRFVKNVQRLLDHIGYHGPLRFICSLCNQKYSHPNPVRHHMKTYHNVNSIIMTPTNALKNNPDCDEFVIRPKPLEDSTKESVAEVKSNPSESKKLSYLPNEIDKLPIKSVFSYNISCGVCKTFTTKVRTNIIRHLQLHLQDFSVPDTAPVNPVPCLEKNEKMFDKMINLAISSVATSCNRMGTNKPNPKVKDNEKLSEDFPAFIPTSRRYVCCAVGCDYLCLGESNLRHHMSALHAHETEFACTHCKQNLSDFDTDDFIKHLKLHDLHLYKCSKCDFIHNLKHKIEKHFAENCHGGEVITIRAMDFEPINDSQHSASTSSVAQASPKIWRCCMCKKKVSTEEEIKAHILSKHEIDSRFKCALCLYKTNDATTFAQHFVGIHKDTSPDFIMIYYKTEDEKKGENHKDYESFDTTPLWQRNRIGVRHIRGILFDESGSSSDKTTKASKVHDDSGPKKVTNKRNSSFIDDGDVVVKSKQRKNSVSVPEDDDNALIILDDPSDNEIDDGCRPLKESEIDLIHKFGSSGAPRNSYYKCPKCKIFETGSPRSFITHLLGEMRFNRYGCANCEERFSSFENYKRHSIAQHYEFTPSASVHGSGDTLDWIKFVIRKQTQVISHLGFSVQNEDLEGLFKSMNISTDCEKNKTMSIKVEESKSYDCTLCTASFSTLDILNCHTRLLHDISPNSKKRTPDEPETNDSSKKTKVDNDKFLCSECHTECSDFNEMDRHWTEMHSIVPPELQPPKSVRKSLLVDSEDHYRCTRCDAEGGKEELSDHFRLCHPKNKLNIYKYKCGECNAKFRFIRGVKNHGRLHTGPSSSYITLNNERVVFFKTEKAEKTKIYKCPLCSYVSVNNNSSLMRQHLKIHIKCVMCKICKKVFKGQTEATAHHDRDHSHMAKSIECRDDLLTLINSTMADIIKNAVPNTEGSSKLQLQTARKSTASFGLPKPYSFYGTKPETINLSKISTTVQIGTCKKLIKCDQLAKLYDIDAYVLVEDLYEKD